MQILLAVLHEATKCGVRRKSGPDVVEHDTATDPRIERGRVISDDLYELDDGVEVIGFGLT